ncbi:ectoine/hydroxyectoine ABC transporter substrate-binding protein EhuB [Paraburkholderia phenoliruptrix]|uniref:Amino acid/amide ABC transporter substrate-binding protein n=2 Tax=Paraburkholderia phenoliruptrix TaxID=252970 RepID=K0E1N9_9BURK|nr:ectoine/hydroxyectoine ABC transporter substrate-binding protein EhuB [Paraburkholderia phenoliruptrix]AFT90353.1 Amino acid/amide ABC transporter substrate-binding protein [Paraburkholderia phenoliruptrix BR3459a]CAB4051774.1 L-cystine-binding protein FliY [Paraburkholderia phenoliruptrix]
MRKLSYGRRAALLAIAVFCAVSLPAGKASAETLKEKVASTGTLTIGLHGAWPYGITTDDGGVAGILPEILKSLTASLGVKQVKFEVMDFGALIPSLMSHRIDVVAGGMYITNARCKQVAFSEPVGGPQGNSALVKAGNPKNIHGYEDIAKNPALRVGDIRGAASVEYLTAAGIPKDQILLFPDKTAAVGALFANRIDALVYDTGTAISILKDPNVKGFERAQPFKEIVNGQEMKHYTAFAFRQEDADFRDAVNKALAQRNADGTVEKVFMKYSFSKQDATPTSVTAKQLCGSDYH